MTERENNRPDAGIGIWQVKIQAQILLIRILINSTVGVEVICIYTSLLEIRK